MLLGSPPESPSGTSIILACSLLVYPRVPYRTGTSGVVVVAFSPILTVDANIHVVLGGGSVGVVGAAHIPTLVLALNVAQNQSVSVIVRVDWDGTARALPRDLRVGGSHGDIEF